MSSSKEIRAADERRCELASSAACARCRGKGETLTRGLRLSLSTAPREGVEPAGLDEWRPLARTDSISRVFRRASSAVMGRGPGTRTLSGAPLVERGASSFAERPAARKFEADSVVANGAFMAPKLLGGGAAASSANAAPHSGHARAPSATQVSQRPQTIPSSKSITNSKAYQIGMPVSRMLGPAGPHGIGVPFADRPAVSVPHSRQTMGLQLARSTGP